MGIVPPYAAGRSVVYCGSGFLPSRDCSQRGAMFGVIILGVVLLIGTTWLFAFR